MKFMGVACIICAMLFVSAQMVSADEYGVRPCIPDRPVPPETIGGLGLPFDIPIWPTLIKTEFHILPWVSFGRGSVCIPGTGKRIDVPAPCFSLKPVPVWFPWLRPLDTECDNPKTPGIK